MERAARSDLPGARVPHAPPDVLAEIPVASLARRVSSARCAELPASARRPPGGRRSLAGEVPDYLADLEATADAPVQPCGEGGAAVDAPTPAGVALRHALRGDCHTHSDWSDGGSPIREMAPAARALGHEYMVLTDHSPRLTVANGLSPRAAASASSTWSPSSTRSWRRSGS